jgi:hypothetical protein
MQGPRAVGLGFIGLSLFLGAAAVKAAGALDGKSFSIDVTEKGKEGSEKDALVFKDGLFRSPGCDQYGFAEAPYSTTAEGEVITFQAVATSEKEGEIHWIGSVHGDQVEGSFIWKKAGQDTLEYSFKGQLKKPE